MDHLGITRADLKPLAVSIDYEMVDRLKRFSARFEASRKLSSCRGLESDEVRFKLREQGRKLLTKHGVPKLEEATDVTGGAIYKYTLASIDFASPSIDLLFDALGVLYGSE